MLKLKAVTDTFGVAFQQLLMEVPVSTRAQRRQAVEAVVDFLEDVLEGEQYSLDNYPDNFRMTDSFMKGEEICESLKDALNVLRDLYS